MPKGATPAKKMAATKKMTETELVKLIAEKMVLPTKQSSVFFDLLASTAIQETKKNGEFTIPGFGQVSEGTTRRSHRPQSPDG